MILCSSFWIHHIYFAEKLFMHKALKGITMISRVCFKVEESGGWCCLNPRWTISFSLISGSVWNYKHTETYKRRHLSCVSLPLAYLTCNGARTPNCYFVYSGKGRSGLRLSQTCLYQRRENFLTRDVCLLLPLSPEENIFYAYAKVTRCCQRVI